MAILISLLLIVAKICDALCIPMFLVFMILKLCNVINWSWAVVCIPLYVLAFAMFITIVTFFISEKNDL